MGALVSVSVRDSVSEMKVRVCVCHVRGSAYLPAGFCVC